MIGRILRRERSGGWGEYFLSRADDDSQWGGAVDWRPQRDEDLSLRKTFWIWFFNFPFYFLALAVIGALLSMAWVQQGQEGFVDFHSGRSIGRFLAGVAASAGIFDLFVCTILRNAWNRRARNLREAETVVGLYE